jgi:hypothetical protein
VWQLISRVLLPRKRSRRIPSCRRVSLAARWVDRFEWVTPPPSKASAKADLDSLARKTRRRALSGQSWANRMDGRRHFYVQYIIRFGKNNMVTLRACVSGRNAHHAASTFLRIVLLCDSNIIPFWRTCAFALQTFVFARWRRPKEITRRVHRPLAGWCSDAD